MSNYQSHLKKLVDHYLKKYRCYLESELNYFVGISDLQEAIDRAASLENEDDKCFDHQRRIKKKAKDHIKKMLPNIMKEVSRQHNKLTFQELYELVRKTITHPGIGELTIYDLAKRIGAKIGVEPRRVYLHCGALTGARNLNQAIGGSLSNGIKNRRLEMSTLPSSLQKLKPVQVENFLCSYKNCLDVKNLKSKSLPAKSCPPPGGARPGRPGRAPCGHTSC